jgi:hypothetical protein
MVSRHADHQPIGRPFPLRLPPELEEEREASPSFLKDLAFAVVCAAVLWTIAAIVLL